MMIRNFILKASSSNSYKSRTLWHGLILHRQQLQLHQLAIRCPSLILKYSTSSALSSESAPTTINDGASNDLFRDPLEDALVEESLDYDLFETGGTCGGEPNTGMAMIDENENNDICNEPENQRTILYPRPKFDTYLETLVSSSCNSISQIFEVFSTIPEDHLSIYHSSQALISLWDIQKYILSSSFDPQREFTDRERFNEQLSMSPIFKSIVQHIVTNCHLLEDDPLTSVLFGFKRLLTAGIKAPESQILIDEALNHRKDTLSLSALAKLSICLKWEGLWGTLIMTEFYPLVKQYIEKLPIAMETGNELGENHIRFLSICIRNLSRSITPALFTEYCETLEPIINSTPNWSNITLAKIYLCLLDCRLSLVPEKYHLFPSLLRKTGHLLVPKIPEMDLVESLSCLQKIIEYGTGEPHSLMLSIQSKISRLIEESGGLEMSDSPPRLDLIQCKIPFIRRSSTVQKQRITTYLTDYIENYAQFEAISPILFKILRNVKTGDKSLYGKYWRKVNDKLIPLESIEPRKVLRRTTIEYLSFIYGKNYTFRHEGFEKRTKKLIYFYLNNWVSGSQLPTLSLPTEILKSYAFLIAVGQPLDPIFQERRHGLGKLLLEEGILSQARVQDLINLSRGINASIQLNHDENKITNFENYCEQLNHFSSMLENALLRKIEEEDCNSKPAHGNQYLRNMNVLDLISIVKVPSIINRSSIDSPLLKKSIELLENTLKPEHLDSKMGIEICHGLLGSNYHSSKLFDTFSQFIQENGTDISLDFAEKFLSLGLFVGADSEENGEIFTHCTKILTENWDRMGALALLRSAFAMSYFNLLSQELVERIFSIDFLNKVDDELAGSVVTGHAYSQKVRQAFMELNRTVCLDMPQSGVPWFHEKYCQNWVSVNPSPPSAENHPILAEIQSTLAEVLNESTDAIQQSVQTPYFYLLNFLIEFDAKTGKPIKKNMSKTTKSFKRLQLLNRNRNSDESSPESDPRARVGIVLLPSNAFTIGTRTLKGYYKLRQRHLEILGYKLIYVDPQHWNSLCMSEPRAKANWIEEQIFGGNHRNPAAAHLSENSEDLDFLV